MEEQAKKLEDIVTDKGVICQAVFNERQLQRLPLLDMQRAYVIGRNVSEGGGEAHIHFEISVDDLDISRFTSAWQTLMQRHEALRAVFHEDGQQEILDGDTPLPLQVVELGSFLKKEQLAIIEDKRCSAENKIYTLGRFPFFNIEALLLGPGKSRIFFNFSLLLVDGLSLSILFGELAQLYSNPIRLLPKLKFSYSDYVLAHSGHSQQDYQEAEKYWRKRIPSLPGIPELPLHGKSAVWTAMNRRRLVLAASDWKDFKAFAAAECLTPSMALCAAYSDVIAHWSRHPRFLLNIMFSNRSPLHKDIDAIVGNFSSLELLAVDVAGEMQFRDRARTMQAQFFQDMEHRAFSGVRLLQALNQSKNNHLAASAPVVFSSNLHLRRQTTHGNSMEPFAIYDDNWLHSALQTPQVWLDVSVSENSRGDLIIHWDSRDKLFPAGLMDDMSRAYQQLLQHLSRDNEHWAAADLSLTPAGQLQEREAVNDTGTRFPDTLLHEPLPQHAVSRLKQAAVITSVDVLSYGDVWQRSLLLAQRLRDLDAEPNQLIAVVMEKGWEQVVAVFAILISGAAYLPIDPMLPRERRFFLMKNAEVNLAITTMDQDEDLEWPDGVVRIPVGEMNEVAKLDVPFTPRQSLDDLAYVIFTSGSTGVPKGVMLSHQGAMNTVLDINRRFAVGSDDRVFGISALNFDLSAWDIFGTAAAGATLVLPDADKLADPKHWLSLLHEHRVSIWNSAPPVMQMLVEYAEANDERLPDSLRLVMLSGDWIPTTLAQRIQRLSVCKISVVSLGGATEASIWSIFHHITNADLELASIPYGKPLSNQSFQVLDEQLRPCPVWVPGHLYIGGIGLAKGYWKDKEKTQHSFIQHPLSRERLYRTGDLGRYLPDGDIEFLGREDNQVKLRGYRIELGEIESILLQHPGIAASVVNVQEVCGDQHLVAYLVAGDDSARERGVPYQPEELKRYLGEQLPQYMVPTHFVFLDNLPLTANGKLDRKALPAVKDDVQRQTNTDIVPPQTETEKRLAAIWVKVLGIQQVSIYDNFFDLGGQSFTAVRVMAMLKQEFGVSLPISALLQEGDIKHLALHLEQHMDGGKRTPLVQLQSGADLSPVFFVHAAGGNVFSYEALARELEDDIPFYAFQADGLDEGEKTQAEISAMATSYCKALLSVHRGQPIILGGWSSGGIVAYEMARQLTQDGVEVTEVVMIDTPAPLEHELVEEEKLVSWFITDITAGREDMIGTHVAEGLSAKARLESVIDEMLRHGGEDSQEAKSRLYRALDVFRANLHALRCYWPEEQNIPVTLFRANERTIEEFQTHPALLNDDWGWSRFVTGELTTVTLSADHYSIMTRDSIGRIACELASIVKQQPHATV